MEELLAKLTEVVAAMDRLAHTLRTTETTTAPKLAYSIVEACAALGVSRPTMYNLIAAGKVRTVMVGGRRLIPVAELDQLLAQDS